MRTVAGERRAASREDPRLHVGVRDVDELHSGPLRENVLAQGAGIALVASRPSLTAVLTMSENTR